MIRPNGALKGTKGPREGTEHRRGACKAASQAALSCGMWDHSASKPCGACTASEGQASKSTGGVANACTDKQV